MAYLLESDETWKLHVEHIILLALNPSLNEMVGVQVKQDDVWFFTAMLVDFRYFVSFSEISERVSVLI